MKKNEEKDISKNQTNVTNCEKNYVRKNSQNFEKSSQHYDPEKSSIEIMEINYNKFPNQKSI